MRNSVLNSKLLNISSSPVSSPALCFLIFEVTPVIQGVKRNRSYFDVLEFLYFIFFYSYYVSKDVGVIFRLPFFPLLREFDSSFNIDQTILVVVVSYLELLQVNSSYICLALFPAITIGFIFVLREKLNLPHGSQQGDEGEASAGSGSDLGSGKEMKKAERQEHDEGEASAGPDGGNKEEVRELVTSVSCWMFYIVRELHWAEINFTVSLFLLFLSYVLGSLTDMMTRLALSRAAPGGTPASALLRKASLVVLLVAVHAVAVELLGEPVVLFILPGLAPLLLWLSVHVDRAEEGPMTPIFTADKITLSRNVFIAITLALAAVLIRLPVIMDESLFSWVAKVVVSCSSSGLLVFDFVFMISQWQGQDVNATPFLKETVKLLKIWASVLLITAAILLAPTCAAAVQLDLHEYSPAEFLNKYVTPTAAL